MGNYSSPFLIFSDSAFYCRCNDCPHLENSTCLAQANTCYTKLERDTNGGLVQTKGCLATENIGLIFCKAIGVDKNVSCCYKHMCNEKTHLTLKSLQKGKYLCYLSHLESTFSSKGT